MKNGMKGYMGKKEYNNVEYIVQCQRKEML